MDRFNPWVIGGGLAIASLLFSNKARAALMPASGRERDLDALADMLITETSFKKSKPEMAQIVYIAINRAKNQVKPIWFVVQPGSGPKPVWNTGALYKKRFEEARNNARWLDARNFAQSVLDGTSGFSNLKKTSFVHPAAMPEPPCASNRVATDTPYGKRCLPQWVLGGQQIGTAWFA